MDILIVAQYLGDIEDLENNNSRFLYIADMLAERKNTSVEIATTNFLHNTKKHTDGNVKSTKYNLTVLQEPGYPKNVCLKRFYSHKILSNNIKKYLESRKKPDCVYCAIPSLDVAYVVSEYCRKNHVRFIIDIQDLWPEAFKMIFYIPVLSDLIFKPMEIKANKIYRQADEIIAVSDTYCQRGKSVNDKCSCTHTVFLGTNLTDFDEHVSNNANDLVTKKENELWLAYCGTLGHSYDLTIVFDALKKISDTGVKPPKFIIMGDGPKFSEFENYANELGVDCYFAGRLPYPKMCRLLSECDMAVNPIVSGAAQSIINKHGDYAAAGLPVLNTQESLEYRNLVEQYQMGINCNCGDSKDLEKELLVLLHDKNKRNKMGKNSRKCAEEKFDRKESYKDICSLITRGES